jgi:endogenous inhibitor of DNA gyrase (YacG/DUF329 family)
MGLICEMLCAMQSFPAPRLNAPMSSPSKTRCPTCRKTGDWFAGKFAPFCSQRCRLLDLGKWLSEEHCVASPLRPEHFEQFENLPPGPQLDRTEENEE